MNAPNPASRNFHADTSRRLVVALPGTRDSGERFWEQCIVANGWADRTDFAFQANAFTSSLYPTDLQGNDTAQIQYRHTQARINSTDKFYIPASRLYTHAYLDYEPRDDNVDGPAGNWQWQMFSGAFGGYQPVDQRALQMMRAGAVAALERNEKTAAAKYSTYRIPATAKRPLGPDDEARAMGIKDYYRQQQWAWWHAYPRQRTGMRGTTAAEWQGHLETSLALHQTMAGDHDIEIVAATWPSYSMTERDAIEYADWTFPTLTAAPIRRVLVWADVNHSGATNVQIRNFNAMREHYAAFLQGGE